MQCFKCNDNFDNVNSFSSHLKDYHLLRVNSVYECLVESCKKKFTCRNSFYKHLKNIHKFPTSSTLTAYEDPTEATPQQSTENESVCETINTVEASKSLEEIMRKNFMSFLQSLHADRTLTKKSIQTIFESINQNILDPILNLTSVSSTDAELVRNAYKSLYTFHKYSKQ